MAGKMTQQEMQRFLHDGKVMILSTLEKDGSPIALPMWYCYEDGNIYMRTSRRSHKVQDVLRDNRVCCVVETGDKYSELRAVVLKGRCTVLEEGAEFDKGWDAMTEKYAELRNIPLPPKNPTDPAQRRVILKIVPEKFISWDYGK